MRKCDSFEFEKFSGRVPICLCTCILCFFFYVRLIFIHTFQHLHDCIFPAPYPPKFFKEALEIEHKEGGINKIAYFNGKEAGVLSARIIPTDCGKSLYLTSLGCKLFNRRQGIGALLLKQAIEWAKNQDCGRLYLHVQEGNEAAIEFYRAKDFQIEKVVPGYYTRLNPSNAFIMYRNL